MFTGLVEEVGRVAALEPGAGIARVRIDAATVLADARLGDSISVDGCCLTMVAIEGPSFTADLMGETLRVTTLGTLRPGDPVNLERAAALGTRLGSHLVQGHVDGVGRIRAVDAGASKFLEVEVPSAFTTMLVPKGSVTVAGVGLTVVEVGSDAFTVGLIPHTLEATTLGRLGIGDRVNVELDLIAKYVARLLAAGVATPYGDGFGTFPEIRP
jgi:riboflavin synthase